MRLRGNTFHINLHQVSEGKAETFNFILSYPILLQNDEGVRIINDCSAPHGDSINDSNSPEMRQRFPYNMSQPADVIKTIMDYGPEIELFIDKLDLTDAFKLIPVKASAWNRQTLLINGVLFIDNRLLFGDNNSAHTFVYVHEVRLKTPNIF